MAKQKVPEKEVEFFIVHKEPEYVFEVIMPGTPEATATTDVRHGMALDPATCGYCAFSHLINERKWISEDGERPKSIAVMRLDNTKGIFILGINFPVFLKLSHAARREVLKFQLLRIPYGHFSTRTKDMLAKYGPEITERALQMVLSQIVNPAILAEEGIILPVPEFWEFERGLMADEYAQKLMEKGHGSMPKPNKFVMKAANGKGVSFGSKVTDPELKKLLEELLDGNGLTKMDTAANQQEQDGSEMDGASRNTINQANSLLESQYNSDIKSQGWFAGDCESFIKALMRKPKISWLNRLRSFCGRHTSKKWMSTPRRPSRRLPPRKMSTGKVWAPYFGKKRDRVISALFIVDTSGSMGEKELRCVDAELRGLHTRGVVIYVLQVDAGVAKEAVRYRPGVKFENFYGRGGTSFEPGFEYALNMWPKPAYIVYFTDGYGSVRQEFPGIDTLWVLTSTGYNVDDFKKNICSWGDAIQIDVEE